MALDGGALEDLILGLELYVLALLFVELELELVDADIERLQLLGAQVLLLLVGESP